MSEYTQTISPTDGAYIHRPDGKKVPLVQAVYELNNLLARAEEAETALANREVVLAQMQSALHATYAETHHPDIGASERKPMMPHERIEWLGKDRNNWEARAKAAEEERDELMRKLSEATAWPAKPVPVTTRVETISACVAKASSIPVNTSIQPDWQRVRIDAAIAAMQGIVSSRVLAATIAAELAKDYANALVAELKKEEVE